jgi:hypothetical protein
VSTSTPTPFATDDDPPLRVAGQGAGLCLPEQCVEHGGVGLCSQRPSLIGLRDGQAGGVEQPDLSQDRGLIP